MLKENRKSGFLVYVENYGFKRLLVAKLVRLQLF